MLRESLLMTSIPDSYENSRDRFRAALAAVRDLWPAARLTGHPLPCEPDLTIDWISANAAKKKEKLFILTTGEHGVEGYVGAAMMQLFIEEFLPRLDPRTTGLLLVHAINPWAMKHRRRVNADNVDLNRSFVRDLSAIADFNPGYAQIDSFLNPQRPIKSVALSKIGFALRMPSLLLRFGVKRFREAALMGQYRHPRGLYYGGEELPEETRTLIALYQQYAIRYTRILHLDMHTGYGPRYQMTLVNSAREKMTSQKTADRFGVARVAAIDPDEFYSIQGDQTDYVYDLVGQEFPEKRLYSAAFEFGTFGDSLGAAIRSMRTMIFENCLHWHGGSKRARKWIEAEFLELYAPSEPAWFEKAKADARQAFEGILKAEGYLRYPLQ